MPIRLNLLAEAQAAEELRRRDPVKRGLWVAAVAVAGMLGWSAALQIATARQNDKLHSLETRVRAQTNDYRQVLLNQTRLRDTGRKLHALHLLATNRFLWGTVLNALQQTTLDDVQVLQIRGEQSYQFTPATPARTNEVGRVQPGTPARATERIRLVLRAKDTGPGPGDQINKFKEMIATFPLFKNALAKADDVRLTSLSAPQREVESGKLAVEFTLELHFPQKERRYE